MTKSSRFTDADMAAVSDNPEWTAERLARSKSFDEVFPELVERMRNKGVDASEIVQLRLDSRVIGHFKDSGPGWESRINDALKKVVGL